MSVEVSGPASAEARRARDGEDGPTERIAYYTLGCKVNQAETEALAAAMTEAGYQRVPFESRADAYVVNTCTVTHVADAKSRQVLRQAKRTNPNALVIAMGCYASIARDSIPVDGIVAIRNRDKERLPAIIRQSLTRAVDRPPPESEKAAIQGLVAAVPERSRPMVKAQDGCDGACAYCIIPRARGRSRSVPIQAIRDRVQHLADQGHQEIVITGVDLGSYGRDNPSLPDLGGLLEELLRSTSVHRLRVSSVEPGDFNREWLPLWQDERLCRHLHVPLQAGCDAVLSRMRRQYTTLDFLEMVDACRKAVPGIAITTDVIVGLPGETDDEFREGQEFIERCRFDGMHVFPYSRRPGTAAALSPEVRPEVKKERSLVLRRLGEEGRRSQARRSIGSIVEVVWESEQEGIRSGISGDNLRVFAADPTQARVERRRLTGIFRTGCWSEPAPYLIVQLNRPDAHSTSTT